MSHTDDDNGKHSSALLVSKKVNFVVPIIIVSDYCLAIAASYTKSG